MPSSTPNWAHDSSLEISLCLVIIWLINKVIWPTKLGENLIFPRSLQRCLWFSWGNDILDISLKPWHLCKKWKRFFFFGMLWTKTSLSFSKIHLWLLRNSFWVKLVPMCETRDFVEMERNEGDRGLLNSWGNFWEWGGMLGSRGKWNLRDWVRGRGWKGQNTGQT